MYIRSPDWHIWRSDDSPHGSFVEHKGKQINQPRRNVEPAKLLERKKKANISLIESHGWLQSFISFAGSRLKEVVIIPGPPLKKPRGTPGQACHAETSLTKCGEITWYWRHHFSPPTPPEANSLIRKWFTRIWMIKYLRICVRGVPSRGIPEGRERWGKEKKTFRERTTTLSKSLALPRLCCSLDVLSRHFELEATTATSTARRRLVCLPWTRYQFWGECLSCVISLTLG